MVEIKWLSHAGFKISFKKETVFIDPFLSKNPKAKTKVSEIRHADYVVVSHDHFDHVGGNDQSIPDSFAIAKNTGARLVGMFEFSQKADSFGISNAVGMNIGSMSNFGSIEIGFTQAVHSGEPHGILLRGDDVTIYHAGDTALFGDMRLIGEMYKPDIAMLPIGGFFTMGPEEAAAAADMIRARITIPMHYNTFDQIKQDPKKFAGMVQHSKVKILDVGESFEYTAETKQIS